MNEKRRADLLRLTRNQIANAIEDDINGERIMKEVWEECADRAEQMVVEDEMRALVALIRRRK